MYFYKNMHFTLHQIFLKMQSRKEIAENQIIGSFERLLTAENCHATLILRSDETINRSYYYFFLKKLYKNEQNWSENGQK